MYVARFTCSTERSPASTVSAMSAIVWSRWKSTKCREVSSLGTNQYGASFGTSPAAAPTTDSHGGPSVGTNACDLVVEPEAAADRAPQREVRVPAARHEERIALDRPSITVGSLEMDRLEPSVALGPGDDPAAQHLGVPRVPEVGFGPAHVRDRGHLAAVRDEVRGRAVGASPRGEHDRARADEHPVLEVQRRGVAQHHARPVVVGERDRTLERAGCEDHAPRADVPEPVEFVRVLEHGDVPVVVQAERRRAREVRDALGPEVPAGAPLDRPMLLDEHARVPRARRRRGPGRSRRARSPRRAARRARSGARRGGRGGASPRRRPTPGRLPTTMPSTTSTMVAATIGSNHGSEISTNAFGSSTPAENTPRGRPRIGLRNGASIPFARIALAIVSPTNAATSSPSNVNEIGFGAVDRRPTRRPSAERSRVALVRRGRRARRRTSPCLERSRTTGGTPRRGTSARRTRPWGCRAGTGSRPTPRRSGPRDPRGTRSPPGRRSGTRSPRAGRTTGRGRAALRPPRPRRTPAPAASAR